MVKKKAIKIADTWWSEWALKFQRLWCCERSSWRCSCSRAPRRLKSSCRCILSSPSANVIKLFPSSLTLRQKDCSVCLHWCKIMFSRIPLHVLHSRAGSRRHQNVRTACLRQSFSSEFYLFDWGHKAANIKLCFKLELVRDERFGF